MQIEKRRKSDSEGGERKMMIHIEINVFGCLPTERKEIWQDRFVREKRSSPDIGKEERLPEFDLEEFYEMLMRAVSERQEGEG